MKLTIVEPNKAFPAGYLEINDARILWPNFEGRGDRFNKQGDRHFTVVIPDQEIANALMNDKSKYGDGWNVKIKPARDEGEKPFMNLKVKVSFNGRGPNIYLVSGNKQVQLTEETVKMLAQINAGNMECPVLSEGLKAEVEEKWIAPLLGMQDDHHWYWGVAGCEYYGAFEGYDVLCYVPNGYLAVTDSVTIGDYTFDNAIPFEMFAYKNERLYSLEELYDTNQISEKTIKSVWEKFESMRKTK